MSLSLYPADHDETVWNCIGLSCPSTFSCPIFGGQVVSAYIRWFQTEPLGPSWRLGVLVRCFFDRLIDRHSSEGGCWSHAELNTLLWVNVFLESICNETSSSVLSSAQWMIHSTRSRFGGSFVTSTSGHCHSVSSLTSGHSSGPPKTNVA